LVEALTVESLAFLAAGLWLASPSPVVAQSDATQVLETIVVTSSRLDSATSVGGTTIDRATIEMRDKPSIPILLADAVGLHTNVPGSRGSVGEVLIRGAEPNFSAVLVDGVQINDPTNTRGGSFDFAALSVDEIESIEVLNGPLSSIYGSDALGGVINIVTRRASERLSVDGTIAGGNEDYARYAARVSGPTGQRSAFAVNAANLRDGRSDADASARVQSLNGSFELAGLDDRSSLVLHARRNESSFVAFPDSSGGPVYATSRERALRDSVDTTIGGTWLMPIADGHQLTVMGNAFDHDERVDSPGVAPGPGGAIPPNRSQTQFTRRTVTAFVNSIFGDAVETAVGLSLEQQAGNSVGTLEIAPGVALPTAYSLDRDNSAVFAEIGLPIADPLRLEAALRIDDSNVAARATTHRINLSYSPSTIASRVYVAAARAYKLPSLFALGDPLTGNSELRPETAESWEVGIDFGDQGNGGSVGVALFAQQYVDLIEFDFDTFRNVNRDRVDTHGIEWRAHRRLQRDLTLIGTATWLEIDVAGSPSGLRQRPEHYASFAAEWLPTPALSIYASLRYVGSRRDEAIPTAERTLGSYTRADIAVRWQLSPQVSLGLALDDIGDQAFEDAIGFPSLGRRYRLSLSANLPAS
jgi:vitamin B12 transporter